MASTHKSLRSSTANKRPTTAIADGQIALNTNTTSPGLFFKDSTGATIIKVGPVHVGTTAPNATPASGGSSGNSTGEVWLDTSLTPNGVKIWNGSAWVNVTPAGSTTVQGLLELATDAETQTGSDTDRAVTPAGLQSKISDSTSTTSSTTIASSTAVKSAYDLANAALPKSGGTVTGALEIGNTGSLSFEGATADGFETTIAVTDPTADRTITLPDTTGTLVTTGDTGTVTSTMLLDGTIVNADVNASAAIAGTKVAPDFGSQTVQTTGIFSHALGTATAPTVTFTGDTNTGIYSPGADQVAISTNGTGRLFVDASGRVGINKAIPTTTLHIAGSTPALMIEDTSGATAGVESTCLLKDDDNFQIQLRSAANVFVATAYLVANDAAGITSHQWRIGNTERMRLDSTGRLGLGTSSPGAPIEIVGKSAEGVTGLFRPSFTTASDIARIELRGVNSANAASQQVYLDAYQPAGGATTETALDIRVRKSGDTFHFPSTIMTLRGSGNVGIGTTSPGHALHVSNGNDSASGEFVGITIGGTNSANARTGSIIKDTTTFDLIYKNQNFSSALGAHVFRNGPSEHARIDSSGRLLVGTSTARANLNSTDTPSIQLEGTNYNTSTLSVTRNSANASSPNVVLAKSRNASVGGNTAVLSGDTLGIYEFQGNDGTNFIRAATIAAAVDGTPGANDMPGRLVFSTTADGASTPAERMRINNVGASLFGKTADNTTDAGTVIGPDGYIYATRDSNVPLVINRLTNDGVLVSLRQANVEEGAISVSGTTVTYGGGHLARWSQLPNDEDPASLLKGTVLSNLDEMCEWGDEDNEQLNRMKVSDVEGDPSVAGVFVSTSFSDDGPLDFFCAMTGDMIIRIAEGVTVQRGDLLMSAGDGTAKPQDDDIIRSKTIAKVTSTHVTCTYDDGSYCVPCVLMAC
jgi:hypothetical protein